MRRSTGTVGSAAPRHGDVNHQRRLERYVAMTEQERKVWSGLTRLLDEALVASQGAAQGRSEEVDGECPECAPASNPELLAAIERCLLRENAKRACMDCGKYPATTRSGLCSRCYVFNKC